MRCKICGKEAVTYAFGMNLCKEDFNRLFERRIEKVLKKYKPEGKIAIALSGGKDSMVLLHYFAERDYDIFGYFINLGIGEHSDKMEKLVRNACKEYGVELIVTNLREEYGFGIENVRRKPCSACGTVKRYLMNKVPRENGASVVTTGHNMDDFLDFFFKNTLAKNYQWNRNMVPYLPSEHPKMLPKIRPLYLLGDKEIGMYAKLNNVPYSSDKCPLAKFSGWKEIFYEIEAEKKNFRYQMILSIWEMADFFPEERRELRECKKCGEPTSGEICAFCKLRDRYGNPYKN
ncbi:PP-loop domain protein [Aciduliprofundum boonei T469]|uniref:PP-loop domain protein n=2 Tax=Candidatus Aciduliprofundum boonei TaxID=379547 RepID=D3TDE2_ACIB4|nr:PP-loop domain protein [Aciduliprofundum boonei T469]HII55654.1 adenine nucleotide alpha hydrolase family protein [Candidatus Aciduliprofundum boonei]